MAPSEIDDLVLSCKSVVQVGVTGVPASSVGHDDGDAAASVPRAFVIKKPESRLTEDEVDEHVKGLRDVQRTVPLIWILRSFLSFSGPPVERCTARRVIRRALYTCPKDFVA